MAKFKVGDRVKWKLANGDIDKVVYIVRNVHCESLMYIIHNANNILDAYGGIHERELRAYRSK